MSETGKYRHLVAPYCFIPNPDTNRFPPPYFGERVPGTVLDLASGGDPVVPWAFQLELPHEEYAYYNANTPVRGPIQIRANAFTHRAVEHGSLDAVYASHLLEDKPPSEWQDIFALWSSFLKPGGYLIILVPERNLWAAALARGQSPNCSHAGPEPLVGDIGRHGAAVGLEVVEDRLTALDPNDYTILTVLRRP
jgi:SAM-dependent methyltransferase